MPSQAEVEKYSDPKEVMRRLKKIDPNKTLLLSHLKTKKYKIWDGQRYVHFGAMGYEDYTKHKDQKRIEAFKKRNARWKNAPKWSAGWLSWNLLW